MDQYTLLETYNPNSPPKSDPSKEVTRETKNDAFYSASVISKDSSEIPDKYQSILSDISRFGTSSLVSQVVDNYRDQKKIEQRSFAEQILTDSSKTPDEKLTTLRDKISQDEKTVNPQAAYVQQLQQESPRTTINVVGGDAGNWSISSESNQPKQTVDTSNNVTWEKIPGKVVNPSSYGEYTQKAFNVVEKAVLSGLNVVVAETNFAKGVAGTIHATKGIYDAVKNQSIGKSATQVGELGLTTLDAIARTVVGGLNGAYQVIASRDSEKALKAIKDIQQGIYIGDGELYNKGLELLTSVGEVIDTPFQLLGLGAYEATYAITKDPTKASLEGTVFYVAPIAAMFAPILKRAATRPIPKRPIEDRIEPEFGTSPSTNIKGTYTAETIFTFAEKRLTELSTRDPKTLTDKEKIEQKFLEINKDDPKTIAGGYGIGVQERPPIKTTRSTVQSPEQRAADNTIQEALNLLDSVDAGGVPAFITQKLKTTATKLGIAIEDTDTPNSVISKIRESVKQSQDTNVEVPPAVFRTRNDPSVFRSNRPDSNPLSFSPDAPIDVTANFNRAAAAKMAADALKESLGTYADALGTTVEELISNTILPKLDPELAKIHPDAYQRLQELDAEILRQLERNKVDPYLFDPAAIKNDFDKYMKILESQNNLYIMRSSSYIEPTGTSFRGHIIYGKAENTGFADAADLHNNYLKLLDAIHRETNIPYNKIKLGWVEDPITGDKFLRWDFEKYFDPVRNTGLGTAALEASFMGFDVSAFANTSIGSLIFQPSSRLIEWISQAPGQAAIRATKIVEVYKKALRERILTMKPQRELYNLITRAEDEQKYFTPQEIREAFPNLPKDQYLELVEGFALFRRAADHLYNVTNTMHRDEKILAGFQGLYTIDGKSVTILGRKLKENPEKTALMFDQTHGDVQEIYDFTPVSKLDADVKSTVTAPRGAIPVNSRERLPFDVYELDRPIVVNGKTYRYATGVQGGEVPKELIPKIVGYFPHINDEPYFIKAYPKELWLDGNKIELSNETQALFDEAATTVGVARSAKSARQFARDLQRENPEYRYDIAEDKLTTGKDLDIINQHAKFAKDWASTRKRERLTLPDGTLGRLKDPLIAMSDAFTQAAKSYTARDYYRLFKDRWVETYGIFTEGKFPTTLEDIKPPAVLNDTSRTLLRAARESFEQHTKQVSMRDTFLDRAWQSGVGATARFFEDRIPVIAEAARKLSTTREPFLNSLLKISHFINISANPQKQYIVQTGQVYEMAGVALLNGNAKFAAELALYAPQIFYTLIAKQAQASKYFPDIGMFVSKDPNVLRMVKAFEDSGIPSAINMHAVVDGVFLDGSKGLAFTEAEQIFNKTTGIAKGVVGIPRRYGFDKAELLNQIGLWLYSKSEFERLNPGKAFDDLHNLSEITAKTLEVGNFMLTRASTLPYQEGLFRFLAQYASFGNKAILQPFVSKRLTTQEKVNLTAVRLAMYGKKGILGGQVIDAVAQDVYDKNSSPDKQDVIRDSQLGNALDIWRRGLLDLSVSKMLSLLFDSADPNEPKTDLALGEVMSPAPRSTVPLGDLVVSLLDIASQDQTIARSLASMSGISSIADTFQTLYDAIHVSAKEPETEGEILAYINKTAAIAPGFSNFEQALLMEKYKSLVSKSGNNLRVGTTTTEAVAKFFGINSIKAYYLNDIMSNKAKMEKETRDTAKRIVKALDFIVDTYGTKPNLADSVMQEQDRINTLVDIYATNGLDSALKEEIHKQLALNNRKGLASIISKLQSQKSATYQGYRRDSLEKLQLLLKNAGENSRQMIELMNKEMEQL